MVRNTILAAITAVVAAVPPVQADSMSDIMSRMTPVPGTNLMAAEVEHSDPSVMCSVMVSGPGCTEPCLMSLMDVSSTKADGMLLSMRCKVRIQGMSGFTCDTYYDTTVEAGMVTCECPCCDCLRDGMPALMRLCNSLMDDME